MPKPLQTYPFLFIGTALVIGIWMGHVSIPCSTVSDELLYGLAFVLLLVALIFRKRKIATLLIFISIVIIGRNSFLWREEQLLGIQEQEIPKKGISAIVSQVQRHHYGYKLECSQLHDSSGCPYPGIINLYLRDTAHRSLRGHQVIFSVDSIIPNLATHNPYAFDYHKYSLRNKILGTSFLDTLEYVYPLPSGIKSWRARCLSFFDRTSWSTEQKGIVKALLLGDKSGLSKETRTRFSQVGIAHVLAVSGLHVGILYTLLWAIVYGFRYVFRVYSHYGYLLTIIGIWIFAWLSGGHPSVIRAAIMLTIYVLNTYLFRRQTSGLEIIMCAMVILLAIDPMNLYDVGFQLSFAAVIGIICCLPLIMPMLNRLPLIGRWISSSMVISIIATICTAPILVHYFHGFSLFSAISSLAAIPLAYLIVILGGLLPLLGPAQIYIEPFLGKSAQALLSLGSSMGRFDALYIDEIWLDMTTTISAVLGLFLLCLAMYESQKKLLWASIFCLLSAYVWEYSRRWNFTPSVELIVYHDFDNIQFDILSPEGTVLSVVGKGIYQKNDLLRAYHISNIDIDTLRISSGEVVRTSDYDLQYLNSRHASIMKESEIIIVGDSVRYIPFEKLSAKTVIFTTRASRSLVKALQAKADILGTECWDIRTEGPYIKRR